MNTEPRPGSLSSAMLPPWSSTSRRVSERPEPGALDLTGGRVVELVELVEDALVVFGGNPDAGVTDVDDQVLVIRPSRHPDLAALRR